MRKLTDEQVFDQYQQRFNEPFYIPLQFGHGAVTGDMLMRCARMRSTKASLLTGRATAHLYRMALLADTTPLPATGHQVTPATM